MSSELFDTVKTASTITDRILVGVSGGKDSVCTLDLCMKYFKFVQPFFMYIVKDLSFQESILKYYEKKYNTEIIRLPHFMVSEFMRYGTFRAPDDTAPIVSTLDTYNYLREKTGIYWIAGGERIDDSIVRRAMIKHDGMIDCKRGRVYPIAQWSKKHVMTYIKYQNLKVGLESSKLGFSFRSLAGKELSVIKKEFPKDYEKIKADYPMCDVAVRRFEEYGC